MLTCKALIVACVLAGAGEDKPAAEVSDVPKPVPLTRDQVKEALDKVKFRQPRFPRGGGPGGERGRGFGNREGRAAGQGGEPGQGGARGQGGRRGGGGGGGLSRGDDPVMSLEYPFATELFWIVSRVNNCHYCLGHQENKLLSAGLTDDQIAALDGDWAQFTPAEQAAFAFTRKLTYEPHLVGDDDIARLREHFTEMQALEIVYYVGRYNSMNRRTDGMGLVQQENRVFKTPTSERYVNFVSTTAPVDKSAPAGTLAPAAIAPRPPLESRDEVLQRLAACRTRTPRFSLIGEDKARELAADWPEGPVPQYLRLLANFPRTGLGAAQGQRRNEVEGQVEPLLRAQIAWIAARHDRAWYALGRAMARLKALGQSEDDIFALDAPDSRFNSAEQAAFRLTAKFAVAPQRITDADVESVRQHSGDGQGAEIVGRSTQAAFFNRVTEAAGLQLEE